MLTKNATDIKIKAGPEDGLSEGQFTAYASVFGNVDSYGDIVVKGAFADDLDRWEKSGKAIPLLFGHNMADPDFNIGHVMKAEEDDIGLKVHSQLDLENPKAKQVYRMIKGRRIDQMSALGRGRGLDAVRRDGLAELMSRGIAYKSVAQTQGPVASVASSLMKLGITEMMFDIALLRGDISGADAMLAGTDAAGMLGAPGGRIAGGSSQVQRNIIGERLLGLPREPK